MFGRQKRRVQARQGRYVLRLDERERELIRELLGELRELLALSPDDPRVRRLYPAAYAEDEESEDEYRRLTREELQNGRLASLGEVTRSIDENVLSPDQLTRLDAVDQHAAADPRDDARHQRRRSGAGV